MSLATLLCKDKGVVGVVLLSIQSFLGESSIVRDTLIGWNEPYIDKKHRKCLESRPPLCIFAQCRSQEIESIFKMMCYPSKGQRVPSFSFFRQRPNCV